MSFESGVQNKMPAVTEQGETGKEQKIQAVMVFKTSVTALSVG